jgi:hypothetical protein
VDGSVPGWMKTMEEEQGLKKYLAFEKTIHDNGVMIFINAQVAFFSAISG